MLGPMTMHAREIMPSFCLLSLSDNDPTYPHARAHAHRIHFTRNGIQRSLREHSGQQKLRAADLRFRAFASEAKGPTNMLRGNPYRRDRHDGSELNVSR